MKSCECCGERLEAPSHKVIDLHTGEEFLLCEICFNITLDLAEEEEEWEPHQTVVL